MTYEILDTDNNVTNTIVADLAFMQSAYPEGNYRELVVPEPPAPPEVRHITVGAFFDRFAAQKWPILADTNAGVQALIKDASVRKWINLEDPQVLAGLQMVEASGHDIDPEAIINAPIQPGERP
jgi:hypothetical protein